MEIDSKFSMKSNKFQMFGPLNVFFMARTGKCYLAILASLRDGNLGIKVWSYPVSKDRRIIGKIHMELARLSILQWYS
jgi:hypothetical protein